MYGMPFIITIDMQSDRWLVRLVSSCPNLFFLISSWVWFLTSLLPLSVWGFGFFHCQMEKVTSILPSSRGIQGVLGLIIDLCRSTHCRVSSLFVEGPLVSEVLQEVDQYIMYYEECNGLLQKALQTNKDVAQEGVVCGYNSIGKDSCQVSSRVPCHLCIEVVSSKYTCSPVTGPGLFPTLSFSLYLRRFRGEPLKIPLASLACFCNREEPHILGVLPGCSEVEGDDDIHVVPIIDFFL